MSMQAERISSNLRRGPKPMPLPRQIERPLRRYTIDVSQMGPGITVIPIFRTSIQEATSRAKHDEMRAVCHARRAATSLNCTRLLSSPGSGLKLKPAIVAQAQQLTEWRHDLHQHPELGFEASVLFCAAASLLASLPHFRNRGTCPTLSRLCVLAPLSCL